MEQCYMVCTNLVNQEKLEETYKKELEFKYAELYLVNTLFGHLAGKGEKKLTRLERERLIEELSKQMKAAAAKLEFEQAAYIRDRIKELRNQK